MNKDILSLLPGEIEQELEALGEPKYRAGQIFTWLHRGVRDFDEMTNLPRALREKLKSEYRLYRPRVLKSRNRRSTARSNTSGSSGTAMPWRRW